jgi:hypothetical protein
MRGVFAFILGCVVGGLVIFFEMSPYRSITPKIETKKIPISSFAPVTTPVISKVDPPQKVHWKYAPMYGGSQDDYLVCDGSGEVLIDIIHGYSPGATWDVCRGDGSCYRDFETREQAHRAADEIAGRCR